mmetsp:Transcript_504/g.1946  ORF Transcript_504/g.1946 Transcript_504/m.1946 type:complete len:327 (+) Transcript_504:217-1197(+)
MCLSSSRRTAEAAAVAPRRRPATMGPSSSTSGCLRPRRELCLVLAFAAFATAALKLSIVALASAGDTPPHGHAPRAPSDMPTCLHRGHSASEPASGSVPAPGFHPVGSFPWPARAVSPACARALSHAAPSAAHSLTRVSASAAPSAATLALVPCLAMRAPISAALLPAQGGPSSPPCRQHGEPSARASGSTSSRACSSSAEAERACRWRASASLSDGLLVAVSTPMAFNAAAVATPAASAMSKASSDTLSVSKSKASRRRRWVASAPGGLCRRTRSVTDAEAADGPRTGQAASWSIMAMRRSTARLRAAEAAPGSGGGGGSRPSAR